MTTIKKTYSVGKVKQLIDLNGDHVNFEAMFRVKSEKGEPFDLLVVDQTTLDNSSNLEYKQVQQGEISGTVKQDQNVYQNYFLVIKSNTPCKCDVEIVRKELPKTIMKQPPPNPQQQQTPTDQPSVDSVLEDKQGTNWTKIVLVLGGIAVIGYIIYWLYNKNKNDKDGIDSPDQLGLYKSPPVLSDSIASSFHGSPVASSHHSPSPANPLIGRLKNLRLN